MSLQEITLTLNGETVTKPAEPRTHLADFLREEHLLTGTHLGCEQGVCGACTLYVDGRPVRSCITFATSCDGADVRSIEGFEADPLMARLRAAFTAHHALQCGYCTPGMLATAYDIVRRLPNADETRIRQELSGNICRCTGYAGIVEAIRDVLANDPPQAALQPLARQRRTATGSAVAPTTAPSDEAAADLPPLDEAALADGVELSREIALDAPAGNVWAVMSDIPAVVACIPGASLDGAVEDGIVRGRCVVALGPMRASFAGTAKVTLDAAAQAGTVAGSGRDRLSRSSLDGVLRFALTAEGEAAARLKLSMRYRLKGPLAQFGRPALVAEIADRILSEVAANIAARASGQAAPEESKPLNGLALLVAAVKRLLRLG
ncbi:MULTISPECIES: xanthine dehydrogenase family Fe-S subunit [Oceanibaculum]|uniref:(2Fe-2S)-binding domain-containing protein n=1 Tax=Oceanibaculum indicum P24 TaxID=1207063 RepID=K2K7N4_9PROT|nr:MULTISPECIES: 2Fe-2S iron-sulfur cluster-binding protein [Oceanibaculum]EKE78889.1 (2Fe-2S)-binding domain-containing protein [Oceanibaculum indicum P24]MCH2393756.1 2Fe-2S iron-sulfur cluster-binding protein [Oceanibaculum sp.]